MYCYKKLKWKIPINYDILDQKFILLAKLSPIILHEFLDIERRLMLKHKIYF